MDLDKVDLKMIFIVSILLTYLAAQRIHELGHWIVLQIFNRNPVFGFTGLIQLWGMLPKNPNMWRPYVDPLTGDIGWLRLGSLPQTKMEWITMLIAGQVAQITILYIGLIVSQISKNLTIKRMGLLIAIINSLGQTFYHLKAITIGSYGDEYLLSYYLNIQKWIIHVTLLSVYMFGLAIGIIKLGAENKKIILKLLAVIFLAIIITGPPLIIADTIIRTQINDENPYYQSIIGFSIPVIITDITMLIILIMVAKKRKMLLG